MKKRILILFSALLAAVCAFCACAPQQAVPTKEVDLYQYRTDAEYGGELVEGDDYAYEQELNILDDNYRNYYEIFVSSFADGNGDGKGDLKGVLNKLDYIADLGFTGIWLMPISPSPSYHKYDVTDYKAIDPAYGTMEDFDALVAGCKERGIKLILDLVINHSSSQHPWFQAAVRALDSGADSEYISYYNFSETGGAGYHRLSNGWWYEGQFTGDMPDLNMDSEPLRAKICDIAKFWLDKGVGGFRLDAAMHIYNNNDNENAEFWKWFSDYCKSVKEDAFLVGEVWTNDIGVLAKYQGSGISVFNYRFGDSTGTFLQSVMREDSGANFAESLMNYQRSLIVYNETPIDCPFLTNHDNSRSANALAKSLEGIKMAAALYLMAPGATFTYYGEEIGMLSKGTKDENKRLPMLWSYNSGELCDAPPNADLVEQFYPPVSEQVKYSNLPHAFYKRALRIRNENPEIARGMLTEVNVSEDANIAAYRSEWNGSSVIVIHNLNRKPVTLTLSKSALHYSGVRGYLSATGEGFYIDGETFTFPAFSTLILK